MNYTEINADIDANIKTNGNREITAVVNNAVLKNIVNFARDAPNIILDVTNFGKNLKTSDNTVQKALQKFNDKEFVWTTIGTGGDYADLDAFYTVWYAAKTTYVNLLLISNVIMTKNLDFGQGIATFNMKIAGFHKGIKLDCGNYGFAGINSAGASRMEFENLTIDKNYVAGTGNTNIIANLTAANFDNCVVNLLYTDARLGNASELSRAKRCKIYYKTTGGVNPHNASLTGLETEGCEIYNENSGAFIYFQENSTNDKLFGTNPARIVFYKTLVGFKTDCTTVIPDAQGPTARAVGCYMPNVYITNIQNYITFESCTLSFINTANTKAQQRKVFFNNCTFTNTTATISFSGCFLTFTNCIFVHSLVVSGEYVKFRNCFVGTTVGGGKKIQFTLTSKYCAAEFVTSETAIENLGTNNIVTNNDIYTA